MIVIAIVIAIVIVIVIVIVDRTGKSRELDVGSCFVVI